MSIQDQIATIPRTVVRTGLQAGRLPLQLVEQVANRDGEAEEWPPLLAYDAAQAAVKLVVGSALRDQQLVAEARLAQARVEQLRKAAELEAKAEADKARAEREARQREQQLEQRKAEEQRRVEEQARKQREAAAKREEVAEDMVTKRERAARKQAITAERKALTEEREAAAAAGDVVDLTEELDRTKAVRKARNAANR